MNDDSVPATTRRRCLVALTAAGASAFGIRQVASLQVERRTAEVTRREQEAAARRAAAEAEARRLAQERAELEQRLRSMIRRQAVRALEAAQSEDTNATLTCIADFQRELSTLHEHAGSFIPDIANGMGSVHGVARNILLMARDKMTGSNEMQVFLDATLTPITADLVAMRAAGDAALARLAYSIDGNSNRASSRLIHTVKQIRSDHGVVLSEFASSLEPVVQAINAGSLNLGLAVAALPLEIAGVAALLNWLRSRLDKWVARAAATGSANIALVAVDGPFPIGDAVALLWDIGFTVWAIWDVHHLSKQVPGEISNQLSSGINTYRDNIIAALQTEANRLQFEANAAREQAFAPLLALGR